jgi:hypothetical protein
MPFAFPTTPKPMPVFCHGFSGVKFEHNFSTARTSSCASMYYVSFGNINNTDLLKLNILRISWTTAPLLLYCMFSAVVPVYVEGGEQWCCEHSYKADIPQVARVLARVESKIQNPNYFLIKAALAPMLNSPSTQGFHSKPSYMKTCKSTQNTSSRSYPSLKSILVSVSQSESVFLTPPHVMFGIHGPLQRVQLTVSPFNSTMYSHSALFFFDVGVT